MLPLQHSADQTGWLTCCGRGSTPGLLRGRRKSYHYTTQPTDWPICCSWGSNPGLLRGWRESYHYTTQPTDWSSCWSLLISNTSLFLFSYLELQIVKSNSSFLIHYTWSQVMITTAIDLLSSTLSSIASSHCFAVLFGFNLTLAVVQCQKWELSLFISVINISFKSVFKLNLYLTLDFSHTFLCECI